MGPREHIERLLAKSAQDEYVLDRLLADENAPGEVFGFHAQQAAEKLLKAALVASGMDYPRTHRLVELLDLLRSKAVEVPLSFDELRHLTPFAVEFRYDVSLDEDPTPLDKPAIRFVVREVRSWAERTVNELLGDRLD